MFTGIIDHCGVIVKIEDLIYAQRLWVQSNFTDLQESESMAVNGICLTVVSSQNNIFYCDISPETLHVTTARHFQITQSVNLERALLPTTRMGGHMVQGHVDQVGQVKHCRKIQEFIEIQLTGLTAQSRKCVIKKGSIAVNGVSLTVNDVCQDEFNVMCVPQTIEKTNLGFLQEGQEVNIECDVMARIIVERCEQYLTEIRLV